MREGEREKGREEGRKGEKDEGKKKGPQNKQTNYYE